MSNPTPTQIALSATLNAGKSNLLAAAPMQIKAQKINHLMVAQPVEKIPGDAAKNQPQRNLPRHPLYVEMPPPQKKPEQRHDRDNSQ